jgi:hypothetical protein
MPIRKASWRKKGLSTKQAEEGIQGTGDRNPNQAELSRFFYSLFPIASSLGYDFRHLQ